MRFPVCTNRSVLCIINGLGHPRNPPPPSRPSPRPYFARVVVCTKYMPIPPKYLASDASQWKRSIALLAPTDAHLFAVVGGGRQQAKAQFDSILHAFARLHVLCQPPTARAASGFDAIEAARLNATVQCAIHEYTAKLERARVPAIHKCRSEMDELAKRAQCMSVTASFLVDRRQRQRQHEVLCGSGTPCPLR